MITISLSQGLYIYHREPCTGKTASLYWDSLLVYARSMLDPMMTFLLTEPMRVNFTEILIKFQTFSVKKMNLSVICKISAISFIVLNLQYNGAPPSDMVRWGSFFRVTFHDNIHISYLYSLMPCHYQNQCWLSAYYTLRNKFQLNLEKNTTIFIQGNSYKLPPPENGIHFVSASMC